MKQTASSHEAPQVCLFRVVEDLDPRLFTRQTLGLPNYRSVPRKYMIGVG